MKSTPAVRQAFADAVAAEMNIFFQKDPELSGPWSDLYQFYRQLGERLNIPNREYQLMVKHQPN